MNRPLFSAARALALSMALGLAACATTPRPPPEFHVAVTHTVAPRAAEPTRTPVVVGRFEDLREQPDGSRVGEVHTPGYPPIPITGPPPQAAAVGGGLVLLSMVNPQPTGWFVYLKGPDGLAPPVARAIGEALNRAGYPVAGAAPVRLEGAIRAFWLRPSWTTRCDVGIELRLIGEGGSVAWANTVTAHAEKFVGWFGDEAFEEVVRMAMDELVRRAAAAFASPEFAAAASRKSTKESGSDPK